METASFCGGVRRKRYRGQLEIAPENLYYSTVKKLNKACLLNFLTAKKN
jgi:hypothetical protein